MPRTYTLAGPDSDMIASANDSQLLPNTVPLVPGSLVTSDDPDPAFPHLQRAATLGTLAAGLGHDLRNLVMPVLLRLDAVASSDDLSAHIREDIASIRVSVARLQQLAASLRLLASSPSDSRDQDQHTDLITWWAAMHALVVDALPPGATLHVTLPRDIPAVATAPGALAQVVMQLILNARQALEHVADPDITVTALVGKDTVQLRISDNGPGMDEETRRRCFDPFFTTRVREWATGMGLATSRALMQRQHGDLTLDPATERGASFAIHIPILQDADTVPRVRTVRVLATDPRQLAMVRHVIAHLGLREVISDSASADLVICTPETLQTSGLDGRTPREYPARQIVLSATAPPPGLPASIAWIHPAQVNRLAEYVA